MAIHPAIEGPGSPVTPRRLLIISSGLPTGGAELRLLSLLETLDRGQFEPCVLSLLDAGDIGPRIRQLGIAVETLNLGGIASLPRAILTLVSLLRGFRPELIQGWMYHANLVALMAGLLTRGPCPVFFGIRNALGNWDQEKTATRRVIRLNAYFSRFAANVIFPGKACAEQHWALGFSKANSRLIENGIDCQRFQPDPEDRCAIRIELGLEPSDLVIGFVARFHPVKDHASFLSAAARVAVTHPNARWLLCGPDIDHQNSHLVDLIDQAGLRDSALLLGNRKDMPRIYRALDLLALTSISEASPGAVAEAMACGIPCLATEVGGCPETLGDTGWLVPPGNPDAIAEGLNTALAGGREQLEREGARARGRALDAFDLHSMTHRYEDLWQSHLKV